MKKSSWSEVYAPVPESFEGRLCYTLHHLTALSAKRQLRRSRRVTMILVAALIGALAIGCAAYAAVAIRDIFRSKTERIEQSQGRSDDEKFTEAFEMFEASGRGHGVDVAINYQGTEIQLPEITLLSEDGRGLFCTRLEYSGQPPFDPNFIDFTLRYLGEDYALVLSEETEAYRRTHLPATTTEELAKASWEGNTQFIEGLLTTYLSFEIPDAMIDQTVDMEIWAQFDGDRLSIPFVYDPEKARDANVQRAAEYVRDIEEMNREEMDWLTDFAGRSAEIGIEKIREKHSVTLSEMVYDEGSVYFAFALSGLSEEELGDHFSTYFMQSLRIDGITLPFNGGRSWKEVADGCEIVITSQMLNRDPSKLPEESLIHLRYAAEENDYVEFVFWYRWADRSVRIPQDASEALEWLSQAEAQYQAIREEWGEVLVFDLSGQNRVFEASGARLTVLGASMDCDGISLTYTYEILGEGDYVVVAPTETTLNGLPAHGDGGYPFAEEVTMEFMPHDNIAELSDVSEFLVNAHVKKYDHQGIVLSETNITMAFTLDRATAKREEYPYPLDQ